jgi:site-specific DNA recombinase
MKELAAIYTRVSTREQVIGKARKKADKKLSKEQRVKLAENEKKASLRIQRERSEAYCQSQGWGVYKVYEEAGVSGAKEDRPALEEMLADAEAGHFQHIVFKKIDRFGRKLLHTLKLFDELESYGIGVVSVEEGFDSSTAIGRMVRNILATFAEFEREQINERMTEGRHDTAEQGNYAGGPTAYGYNAEDGHLVVNEVEAAVVRRIFSMYVSEGLSQAKIAKRLTAEDVPTKRRNGYSHWHQVNVATILNSPTYLGRAYYGKTVVVKRTAKEIKELRDKARQEGRDENTVTTTKQVLVPEEDWKALDCPAIIDKKLWKAAQDRAEHNRRDSRNVGPQDRPSPFLLSGLLRCGASNGDGKCGGAMAGRTCDTNSNGKTYSYRYYFCTRQHNYATGCRKPELIDSDPIDAAVYKAICDAFSDPQRVLDLCNNFCERKALEMENQTGQVAVLQRKLAEANKERSNYETMLAKELITEAHFREQTARVDKEMAEAQGELKRLAEIAEQHQNAEELKAKIFQIADLMRNNAEALNLERRKRLVRDLVESVELDAKNDYTINCVVPGLLELDRPMVIGVVSTKVKRKTSG